MAKAVKKAVDKKPAAKEVSASAKVKYPEKFTGSTMLDFVATKAELSKKQAKVALEAYVEVISAGILTGSRIPFGSVGKFFVRVRPATKKRQGRNPLTGAEMTISAKPATKVPKFSFGKAFKESAKKAKTK